MKRDSGVILIQVLVVLAIGSAITVLMFTSQTPLLDRAGRSAAALQGEALTFGAEKSVVLALQRDMKTAPETDHYQEDWNAVAQSNVTLQTGTFSVAIVDVQSRFNLNILTEPGVVQSQIFLRLTRSLDLPDSVASVVAQHLASRGAVQTLDEITALDVTARATLAPHVVALPNAAQINLNTANATVIAAVLGNTAAARQLVKQRDKTGFMTPQDLRNAGVLVTNGAGFTSQFFDVTSRADVDGVSITLTSRIARVTGVGVQDTRVISRSRSATP